MSKLAATWCEVLLVATVFASVLAIGTVHVQVLLAVAALAAVGGGLGMLSFRRPPAPALVLGALGMFSLLQAVPLPASLVSLISPSAAQTWLHCLDSFGEPPLRHFSVSLDRGASVAEALKWFSYAAVYLMAARVRLQRGSTWLAMLLFASATLVSIITIVHGAWDYTLVYGVYEPKFAVNRWNVGPLLNSNNFAGYANLGLFTGLGLMLSRNSKLPRGISAVGVGVIVTAVLLSGSRGAILSALAGSVVIAVWLTRGLGVKPSVRPVVKGTVPILFGALTFLVLSGPKEWKALGPGDIERKIAVWRWSLPLIRDHAWLGVGRGAFETAFPPYRHSLSADWTSVASHAENFVIQWIAEWGIPVGLFAIVVVVGYVAKQWYEARGERLRFLLMTSVAVLLLQNLTDLGLEVPSLVIAAVVAVAAGERRLQQPQASLRSNPTPRSTVGAFAAFAAFATVWLAAALWSRWPVEDERREASVSYRALSNPGAAEYATFKAQMRAPMLRHPGEAHFPLLVAVLASQTRAENPLPWLARALELGPSDGRVHLALAEVLGAHQAMTQAMLHLRLAAECDGTLDGTVATRIAQWAPTLDVLKQAIPKSQGGAQLLAAVCEVEQRMDLKAACLRYAITRSPRDGALHGQLAEFLLQAIRTHSSPCTEAQAHDCFNEVERAARTLGQLEPRSWRSGYLSAKNLEAQGDFKSAATILTNVCPSGAQGQQCTRDSVEAAITSGSDPVIVAAADAYAARACSGGVPCAAALDWLVGSLDAADKGALAITYVRKAAELESSADRWLRVAQRARQLQLPGVMRTALDQADRSPDATLITRATTRRLRGQVVSTAAMAP